jgi:hypothetical protein
MIGSARWNSLKVGYHYYRAVSGTAVLILLFFNVLFEVLILLVIVAIYLG